MLQPDVRLGDSPEAVAMLVHPLERVRSTIAAALEAAGWRVICVATSAEAMVRAREAHPSVAVVAAGIECLEDGRHLAVALRHTPDTGPRPRIVLVASAHDERVAALAKAAGGAQVILADRPMVEPEPARVLWVVDDNTAIRTLARGAFERVGWQVLEFENLEDSTRALAIGRPPTAVLLDIQLPDGSGLDHIGRFAGAGAGVVVVSNLAGSAQLEAAFAAGASDVVQKPFELRSLVARVQRISAPPRRASDPL